MKSLVSVVIPNWNGLDMLKGCLNSLAAQTYKPLEVIVVENGSTDGSAAFIKQHYPEVIVLQQPHNLGFAGGVNVGIVAATGEYIALLNNDAVANPDWISQLVESVERAPKQVGFITSKIIKRGTGTLDSTGDFIDNWGFAFPRGRGETDHGQYDNAPDIFSASGGATLYRRGFFDQIGLFDEDFFAYYEDVDLSFRAQLVKVVGKYEPKAVVQHAIGGTSGKLGSFSRYHSVKNTWYVYIKDMPGWVFWAKLPGFLMVEARWIGAGLWHHQPGAVARSYLTLITHLPSMLQKRRQIQRSRTVAPAVIWRQLQPRSRRLVKPLAKP